VTKANPNLSPWQQLTTRQRCQVVAAAASQLAEAADELTSQCASEQRTDPVETIAAELLPLCSALEMIGRRGPRLLRTRYYGVKGRPAWLWGIRSRVHRDPFGDVLILGTWNYPLLLVGTQAAQALAAGNRVIIKPAAGSEAVTAGMVNAFYQSGVPPEQLIQIDSSTAAAVKQIEAGVDLVVLTGAAATGRKVLAQVADSLTPTIMELSGCDAVVILPGADLERTADAIVFGLNFNSGATCIGPRRLIAESAQADQLIERLRERLDPVPPMIVHPAARSHVADLISQSLERGAQPATGPVDLEELRQRGKLRPLVLDQVQVDHPVASADVFAPLTSVLRVDQITEAIELVNQCRYRLGASVFGPPAEAAEFADQLRVGSICVNDLLAPTADPRLPFGGRGDSGFGVTRGEEGLLAMTVPRVVSERKSRFAVHLMARPPYFKSMLLASLQMLHSRTWGGRLRGLKDVVASVRTGDSDQNAQPMNSVSETKPEPNGSSQQDRSAMGNHDAGTRPPANQPTTNNS